MSFFVCVRRRAGRGEEMSDWIDKLDDATETINDVLIELEE